MGSRVIRVSKPGDISIDDSKESSKLLVLSIGKSRDENPLNFTFFADVVSTNFDFMLDDLQESRKLMQKLLMSWGDI